MKRVLLHEQPTRPVSHNPDIGKRVMLDESVVPGLTNFSQAVFSSGQVAPGHLHEDMYEVFFVRRGSGVIVVDGTEYPLLPDECVVVEPGERHEIRNPNAQELVLLYFGFRNPASEVQV